MLDADIGVSVSYTSIIVKGNYRCILYVLLNIHAGDLLRDRSHAFQVLAILNDEEKISFCVHKMVDGVLDYRKHQLCIF